MIVNQKHGIKFIVLLGVIIIFSLILEWLGWRIAAPGIMIWDIPFLRLIGGALTTTAGALFPGTLFILISLVFPRYRNRIKQKWMIILAVGAPFFLLIMLGLILWAP